MKIFLIALLTLPLFAQLPHSNVLTWSWSQGIGSPADGYHVQRSSTSGGPYSILATIQGTATTSYTDIQVVPGQISYYVVTAFNSGGDSTPTNQVVAVTPSDSQFTISGSVQVVNATVTLTGGAWGKVVSGLGGSYGFLEPNGTYTITPTKWRCSFTPPSQTVTLNSMPIVLNFQATGRKCRQ